jgi:hypothetical protein
MNKAFERRTEISAPFDCILQLGDHAGHPQGGQSHGRGGMKIRHILYREDLSVQFLWSPGVFLPETHALLGDPDPPDGLKAILSPMAWDLGYHLPDRSRANMALTGRDMSGERYTACDIYASGCYYDGSALNAEPILEILLRGGSEALWEELEKCHADQLAWLNDYRRNW